jgi:hypothetical protein
MPIHMVKCRKSHSTSDTKQCCFNSTHVVPSQEINVNLFSAKKNENFLIMIVFSSKKYHHEHCPDRVLVERFMDAQQNTPDSVPSCRDSGIHSAATSQTGIGEEDWDDIRDFKTTSGVEEAKARAMNSNVISSVQHGTPSQKKRRRLEENDRLNRLRNNQ